MRYCLLFLALIICSRAGASHLASAEIRYEYTGTGNLYRVYLTLMKACEVGSIYLTTSEPVVFTGPASTFTRNLPLTQGPDTLGSYCTGILNSCQLAPSVFPGFERRIYSDTVTLPPSSWKMEWTLCCRPFGIINLVNPGSFNNYVATTLDNTTNINSSAWLPNPNPLWVSQGSSTVIPLNAVDPENDSIAYEWFQPSDSYNNPIPYDVGYTFLNPLGGGSTLTLNANNTVTVMAATAGKFALGIKIKEYRNGQLIATTMRDFTLVALPSSIVSTSPLPTASTGFNYVTCPGAANSISLAFTDPTPTDSVYLYITAPTMPGWTFNIVTAPALGGATANITWTTPATMNPATMPVFYFNVLARDNSCPAQAYAMFAVAVQTAQCQTDSVWAGDANGDYTVNVYDPLAVAVAFGQTGPVRAGATTTWQAEWCPPWADTFINGLNLKHADCNGDGTVDAADLPAVTANWGMVHLKEGPAAKTSGLPELYFDITGINFAPGSTVSVPIKLGTTANITNNFYGIASVIDIGGITLASPPTISYPANWVGTGANTLSFVKNVSNNTIGWAYAKKDHQDVSGQGTIATVDFTVPTNIPWGTAITLTFSGAQVISKTMASIPFTDLDTTVTAGSLSVNNINNNFRNTAIVPNPSGNTASLTIALQQVSEVEVCVLDNVGKIVYREVVKAIKGVNTVSLPAQHLATGIYMVRVTDGNNERQLVKWLKN